jgi:hypothetical protein
MKLVSKTSQTVLITAVAGISLPSPTPFVNAAIFNPDGPIDECTISAISYLQIPGESLARDEEYGCEDGNGNFVPLQLDDLQKQSLMDMAANGQVNFGLSKIDVGGASINDDGSISLSRVHAISVVGNEIGTIDHHESPHDAPFVRHLQSGTVEKNFLFFRVTDINGLVYPDSASVMSDNVFGTYGDTSNLKSQLTACSVGKYTVVPGGKSGYDISGLESAPGVVDIRIDVSLDNPMSAVRDAALKKAQEVLGGYFGRSWNTPLTVYTDHAMFSLKQCFQECGWAAYAAVGSYYQVRFNDVMTSDYFIHPRLIRCPFII